MNSILQANLVTWHISCGQKIMEAGPIDYFFMSLTLATVVIAVVCMLAM